MQPSKTLYRVQGAHSPDLFTVNGSIFESQRPGLPVTYKANGSEAGVQALKRGEVNFAASDVPPNPSEQDAGLRRVPTVVGAAVPAYSLPEIKRELRFTPELLADIYFGKVERRGNQNAKPRRQIA